MSFHEFGDNEGLVGDYAWYEKNSGIRSHPVGQHHGNGWGLYDMHGNVWEWCLDWYASCPVGTAIDPQGPQTGGGRVVRGGCLNNSASFIRSAFRHSNKPVDPPNVAGFRVVIPIPINRQLNIPRANIGFEAKLCLAAAKMPNNMDAAEY